MTFPLSSALTILKCSLFHSFLNTLYYSFDFSLRFFSVYVFMYVCVIKTIMYCGQKIWSIWFLL